MHRRGTTYHHHVQAGPESCEETAPRRLVRARESHEPPGHLQHSCSRHMLRTEFYRCRLDYELAVLSTGWSAQSAWTLPRSFRSLRAFDRRACSCLQSDVRESTPKELCRTLASGLLSYRLGPLCPGASLNYQGTGVYRSEGGSARSGGPSAARDRYRRLRRHRCSCAFAGGVRRRSRPWLPGTRQSPCE